ncbi:helix-turn-helix domain-containing protein [Cedecea sp. NFIX57]|uniref:helix-turn-helix domain-containing protein n=1 Tax=Cedecea sp. NFIX57 TaxID=1566286 RepID=UPI000A0D0602|nr:helix-turn-helix transcriptional regulator [Cedecea sp. NFIX57]SMG56958.1 transcriptional regulator, Nlp family [Cedecea sp. NFIX57]
MTNTDWHPADVVAALHKRGTSMARVSREAGLASATLANTLKRPWPRGEWLIASVIGIHPAEIWPTRYRRQGLTRQPRKPLGIQSCPTQTTRRTPGEGDF